MNRSVTGAVIRDIKDFDQQSGSVVERLIFNHRPIIVAICLLLTMFFGFEVLHLKLNANFEGTIPTHHPFMLNYHADSDQLQSQGNALRIAVEANQGTIETPKYLSALQNLTDDVVDLPGVDRAGTLSLWTPNAFFLAVNSAGIALDPIIDEQYDGSQYQIGQVSQNILRSGRIGDWVGTDLKSAMIYAPLMNHNGLTGAPVDYGELARQLLALKTKYAKQGVTLHITGFAMVVGDLILGIRKVLTFFAISAVIAACMLYWFTRSAQCTFLVLLCTFIAVVWELGLLPLLGYDLDPYSVLVPFLIFSIGMSHGAQKMNGVMQDIGRGTHRLVAARYTFRRLFVAGFTALVCDGVGFAVLLLIRIQEIRELAVIAICGVAILIFTNLILLPILLSYIGVNQKSALRSLRAEGSAADDGRGFSIWNFLAKFTRRRWAIATIVVAVGLGAGSYAIGQDVQVGNASDGAPELRPNSQYNQDVRYIQNHYAVTGDELIILVDSKPYTCTNFSELEMLDRLGWQLQQMPEVQSTSSLAQVITRMTQLMTDNSTKWDQLVDNQALINDFGPLLPLGFDSLDCTFVPVTVSLYNLKANSLENVINHVQTFIAAPENQSPDFAVKLGAGNGGIAAATDQVIQRANTYMLIWIYGAVAALCFIAFQSWRAVLCAILPLVLTSLMCQALMVVKGIGITVATLPVVALGVGIGVDYALYVLGIMLTHLRAGEPLEMAYKRSLKFTGRVVMLTGFTLAVGVGTWIFAPIKFQSDMGLLLAFMFLWNMFGALVILPALAHFLLKPANVDSSNRPPLSGYTEFDSEMPAPAVISS